MSKTFSYILIVILVYLLVIFPKVAGNNEKSEQKENESNVKKETTIRAGYTV